MDPFIPANTYGGKEEYEVSLVTTLPSTLSLGTCQCLFRSLCTKAHFFCKSFEAIERIGSTHYVIVMLTQDNLAKGTVPAFCSVMTKLKRIVILVNCDCDKADVDQLCTTLGVQCAEFYSGSSGNSQAKTPVSTGP